MSLPILHVTAQVTPQTLVRYFHQTERHWSQHIAEDAQIDVGTAFTNPQLPDVHDANHIFDASLLHLDDPHYDALLALKDGAAVASIGVLAVGEIGRIDEVYVAEQHRRQGLGRVMMNRVLEICARSLFKHVLLSCGADNVAA